VAWDPFLGNVAWPGGPPLGALAAMSAQQAAAAEVVRRAKEQMRSSGVTCETECATGACGIPAVGRCAACDRAFCEGHQSADRSELAGSTTISRFASLTECRDCQDREVTRAIAKARAAHQATEQARRKESERAERERQEHAARVGAWEAETGWPTASERVAWLSARIGAWEMRRPATTGQVAGAALVIVVDPGVLVTLSGRMSTNNNEVAALGLLLFLALLGPRDPHRHRRTVRRHLPVAAIGPSGGPGPEPYRGSKRTWTLSTGTFLGGKRVRRSQPRTLFAGYPIDAFPEQI
jgi:hypothetical protein